MMHNHDEALFFRLLAVCQMLLRQTYHYARVVYYRLVKPPLGRTLGRRIDQTARQLRHIYSLLHSHRHQHRLDNRLSKLVHSLFCHDQARWTFFGSEDHLNDIRKALRQMPELTAQLLHQANEAAQHRFCFLSDHAITHDVTHDTHNAHGELQWHKDYRSGYQWTAQRVQDAHRIDFLTTHPTQHTNNDLFSSDVKYPWELSRHQWWAWLGLGYILGETAEERSRFWLRVQHDALSWIRDNPCGKGINWAMPMELSIRATNWIHTFALFAPTTSDTPNDRIFWQHVADTLWLHGRELSYNLEYVRHPGNHFDSNALGLVTLGAFFYHTRTGKRWFQQGKRFLEREIQRQVYADGVNYEKSTSYHRLVTEIFFLAALVADLVGKPFSQVYLDRLRSMFGYMAAYSRPDGSVPRVGDADNGRILRFRADEDFNVHCTNLVCGTLYFNAPELLANISLDASVLLQNTLPDILFLFHQHDGSATNTIERLQHLLRARPARPEPAKAHKAELHTQQFPHGGYVVLQSPTAHVFVDVGDYGMDGWGGHGHNDCLSFELWLGTRTRSPDGQHSVEGTTFVVDSGTGTYTANPALRNALRSTAAHNTVVLHKPAQNDGQNDTHSAPTNMLYAEQVEFQGLWRIKRDTLAPRVLRVHTNGGVAVLQAEHAGYLARYGVRHRRTVRLVHEAQSTTDKEHIAGQLVIEDELLATGTNEGTGEGTDKGTAEGSSHLHIPPEITIERLDQDDQSGNDDEHTAHSLRLTADCACTRIVLHLHSTEPLHLQSCQISPSYGVVQPATRIITGVSTRKPTTLTLHWKVLQKTSEEAFCS